MDNLIRIASSYERAELTVLLLSKKNEGYYNLFANIELIPAEQEFSTIIGTKERPFERISVDSEYSLFIGRFFYDTPLDAVTLFTAMEEGYEIRFNTSRQFVHLFPNVELTLEPPGGHPLLVESSDTNNLKTILPKRNTAFRFWAKLDKAKEWWNQFDEKQLNKIFLKAGCLTMKFLRFNIAEQREHLGNIYLFGCNPILVRYDQSLLDSNKKLLINFKEREGRTIKGCKIFLEEIRGNNIGFSFQYTIQETFQLIELPYFPDQLITRLYDKDGCLLDKHNGMWVNFGINLNLTEEQVNLKVNKGGKSEVIKIPKHGKAQKVNIGNYDHSSALYFKKAAESRRYQQLEKNKEFIFFPGSPEDKEIATANIREIIEKASDRCILLDPYFGATEIIYAMLIQSTAFPVQIISSANFLKRKVNKTPDAITKAEELLKVLDDYKVQYPKQNIECRVLQGKEASPLHDRYIISDTKVYLLGSSLNEFGSRATTLSEVPTPDKMVKQALMWWNDIKTTIDLRDFVSKLKTEHAKRFDS